MNGEVAGLLDNQPEAIIFQVKLRSSQLFKQRPEFFRLLYSFAKIALITVRIIASLDFTSFISFIISSFESFLQ